MSKNKIFQPSTVYSGGVHVNFSKIFGMNLEEYSDMSMDAKRTYVNQNAIIIDSLNATIKLDRDSEIIANYLMVMHKIVKQQFKTPESFIDCLTTEILKPWFIDAIKEYVKKEYKKYCQSIDDDAVEFMRKYGPSMVFTDVHSILFYQITVTFRFVIPLATHFARVYADMLSTQDASEFYIDAYGTKYKTAYDAMTRGQKLFNNVAFLLSVVRECIWRLTQDDPSMNIYGKLNHYITQLVNGTGYSDSEMWAKLIMCSVSKYNQIDIIMTKILLDVIPKASFKKSIIKFIVTTIEHHIKWAFHANFNINYNMITPLNEDSDFSDADRFDINSVKSDELKKVLQDNFMDDTIDIVFERKNFTLDMQEYDWHVKHNIPHPIQEVMIRNFFAHPFGGYENLDGVNQLQYTKLLCYLLHFMKDSVQFKLLPKVLSGNVVTVNEKRLLSRPVEKKIRESIRYKNIVSKFKFTGNVLQKSNVIEQTIMSILNAKILYNEYNGKHNGETLDIHTDILCDEYLQFVELL